MSPQERNEHEKLRALWATGRATRKQILRCMVLDRLAESKDFNDKFAARRNDTGDSHAA